MGNEQNEAQQYRECPDKFVSPNASYQMTTRDYIMRPFTDAFSGAIVLTLPPVAEARGRFYSFLCRGADAVNTVTITDHNDSECWQDDIVFDGRCDRILLYSDGLTWHPLCCGGGPGDWPGFSTTNAPDTVAPTTAEPQV